MTAMTPVMITDGTLVLAVTVSVRAFCEDGMMPRHRIIANGAREGCAGTGRSLVPEGPLGSFLAVLRGGRPWMQWQTALFLRSPWPTLS